MTRHARFRRKASLPDSPKRPVELQAFCLRTGREIGREVISGPQDIRAATDRLRAKDPHSNQMTIYYVVDPRPFSGIPRDDAGRMLAASRAEEDVTKAISSRLMPGDKELYRKHRLDVPSETARLRI